MEKQYFVVLIDKIRTFNASLTGYNASLYDKITLEFYSQIEYNNTN